MPNQTYPRWEGDIQIVYGNDLHEWAVCPCPQHAGGDLPPSAHGSVRHCCDRPHEEPPGILRFGKPPANTADNEV